MCWAAGGHGSGLCWAGGARGRTRARRPGAPTRAASSGGWGWGETEARAGEAGRDPCRSGAIGMGKSLRLLGLRKGGMGLAGGRVRPWRAEGAASRGWLAGRKDVPRGTLQASEGACAPPCCRRAQKPAPHSAYATLPAHVRGRADPVLPLTPTPGASPAPAREAHLRAALCEARPPLASRTRGALPTRTARAPALPRPGRARGACGGSASSALASCALGGATTAGQQNGAGPTDRERPRALPPSPAPSSRRPRPAGAWRTLNTHGGTIVRRR